MGVEITLTSHKTNDVKALQPTPRDQFLRFLTLGLVRRLEALDRSSAVLANVKDFFRHQRSQLPVQYLCDARKFQLSAML